MDSLNDPFEDFLKQMDEGAIKEQLLSAVILGACQMTRIPKEATVVIQTLLKNGCPAKVILKTIEELTELMKKEESTNDGKDN